MRLDVTTRALTDVAADALVVERHAGEARPGPEVARLDRALQGLLGRVMADERFEGRAGEVTAVHTGGRLRAARVIVVGLGRRGEVTAETLRRAAGAAARRARDLGAARVVFRLLGDGAPRTLTVARRAQAVGEGALLGLYSFDRYKSAGNGAGRPKVEALTVLAPEAADAGVIREALEVARLAAEAQTFARDLINEPANVVTATALATEARAIARAGRLRLRVFDRAGCQRLGMGAFLGVNRGT